MTEDQRLNLQQCARQRAHLAGGQAVQIELMAARCHRAAQACRARYWRELAAVERLGSADPALLNAYDRLGSLA